LEVKNYFVTTLQKLLPSERMVSIVYLYILSKKSSFVGFIFAATVNQFYLTSD
jgi:hypothetical protein